MFQERHKILGDILWRKNSIIFPVTVYSNDNKLGGLFHENILNLKSVSCLVMSDPATPWTVAHQPPLSTEFSRQEYWSGLAFPSPGNLPDPGIEPGCPARQADSSLSEPTGKPTSDKVTFICILTGTKRLPGDLRRLLTPWADRSGFIVTAFAHSCQELEIIYGIFLSLIYQILRPVVHLLFIIERSVLLLKPVVISSL